MNQLYSFISLTLLMMFVINSSGAQSLTDSMPKHKHYASWEFGVTAGGANAYGDMIGPDLSTIDVTRLAYGLFLRYSASPNLGFRLNAYRGKITGSDADIKALANRGFSFETPITEASIMAEWDFRGANRYSKRGHFKKTVSPYAFVGVGMGITDLTTNFDTDLLALQTKVQEDLSNAQSTHFTIPFGIGVKADITSRWVAGAEFGLRPVFNDYLDGLSIAANPDLNDWYSIAAISLSYRFGAKDTDQDGIADKLDKCPDRVGIADFDGCPDTDGDGIVDMDDSCPTIAGVISANGCPDTDGDGIADQNDDCPTEAGLSSFNGCPDFDKDGIMDKEDKCPEVPGVPKYNGCRDSDDDGIIDEKDECPHLKGIAANNGCPSPDRDNDGISNELDKCPDIAGTLDGCPDTDNDQIADIDDECPDVAGPISNRGCPVLKQEDQEVLNLAIKNVRFNTSSYELLESSYPILEQIAKIMKRYPNYNLYINGYTDNRGNDFSNQQLSEYRARSCYDYIKNKGGINESRISYKGYGEARPISNNNTVEGRQLNRRVEFKLEPRK